MVVTDEPINNTELADFVSSTLNAITTGVEKSVVGSKKYSIPSKVSFEVAVKAVRTAGAGAGLKLQIFSAEGRTEKQDEEVSRVSFVVTSDSATWEPKPSTPVRVV